MEYAYYGSTGLKISRIALGTMTFGDTSTPQTQCDEKTAFAILDAYVAAGGNFIDTANIYQGGESERIVGRWLKAHPELRTKVVIATKARNGMPGATGPNDSGLSRAHLMTAVAESLARLQTDYIDVYQMHVWDDGTPVEETLRTLDDLVKASKVRYIGWSNCTGWQLQKIVETSKRLGLPMVASLQQQYSLLCRQTEYEVTDVCERENVALMPWSPLKGGWLSGKMKRGAGVPEGSRVAWAQAAGSKMQSAPTFDAYASDDKVWALLDAAAEIGAKVGGSVAQVSIRWLLQKSCVTSVVIGAKTVAQFADNLAALKIKLSDDDMARLDALSAEARGPVPYPYEMVSRINGPRKRPLGK